jgi:hypothetical protein
VLDGGAGPNANHPRPATITAAPTITNAFTSRGMEAQTSWRPAGTRVGRGPAGRSAGAAAASSSARARVMPQWQLSDRRGTRLPQLGHVQV